MKPDDDLRALRGPDVPSWLDARVQRLAAAELAAGTTLAGRLLRRGGGVLLPGALVVMVVGYLHWAFEASSALYR